MDFGFYLKKMIAYFIEPFGMVFALIVIGLFFLFTDRKLLSKIFLSFGLVLLTLYSYSPFSNLLISNLESQYPKYNYENNVKYIHVLGNGHNDDSSQPLSSKISEAGLKRNLEGILIHLKTDNSKLIFTGFGGKASITTADMNARLAMALGIKKENLIINGLPKDTKEEALFTKTIVGNEPFVLVTSATHMPRSMMLFKSLGLNPIAAPTNFHKSKSYYFSLPGIGNFYKSQIAMHEYIGILWAKLRR